MAKPILFMLEYFERRNRDFIKTVNRLLRDPRHKRRSLRQIVGMAAASPAPDYYVTYSHVVDHIGEWMEQRGGRDGDMRRLMHREICERVARVVARTGCRRCDAVARVLAEGRASCFFVKASTAWVLYHDIMSGRAGRPRRPKFS